MPAELRKELSQTQKQLWEKEATEGLAAMNIEGEMEMDLKQEII
jgi:hypothetical protein